MRKNKIDWEEKANLRMKEDSLTYKRETGRKKKEKAKRKRKRKRIDPLEY